MTDHEHRKLLLSLRAALVLPVAWSLATGTLAGITTAAVLVAFESSRPQVVAAAVGSATMLISWLIGMAWWWRQWRRVRDDKPAQPPAPVIPKTLVRFEHYEQGGRVIKIDELQHTPPDQLRKIARRVVNGEDVTTTFLLSIFKGNRPNMELCRDELIRQEFFVWNSKISKNQGMSVTDEGKERLTPFATGARDSGGFSRPSRTITRDTTEE